MSNCDSCAYNVYDEDTDQYYCDMTLDEDEYARLATKDTKECPYYNHYDEYEVVRHQN